MVFVLGNVERKWGFKNELSKIINVIARQVLYPVVRPIGVPFFNSILLLALFPNVLSYQFVHHQETWALQCLVRTFLLVMAGGWWFCGEQRAIGDRQHFEVSK